MKKPNNNGIETKYDGLRNITYEQLENGYVYFNYDLNNDEPNIVMGIVPNRHYEGKTLNGNARIGLGFTLFVVSNSLNNLDLKDKIVFDIDGERLAVEAHLNQAFSLEQIEMLEKQMSTPYHIILGFDLQPEDIKRIADAKKVSMGLGSKSYSFGRSYMAFGFFQIESIQGVMKRAYHYFVDETCFVPYVKRKQTAIKKEKQEIETVAKAQKPIDNRCEKDRTIENNFVNTPRQTNPNNNNKQNESLAIGTDNNTNNHKITFLEFAINFMSFAIAAIGKDHYHWWFLIVGTIISIILSWLFDAEKYNRIALAFLSVFVFLIGGFIFLTTDWPQWTWLILWPTLYSIMVLILSKTEAKHTTCSNCKKEYAMEVYNTQFLRSENIAITKKEWITDISGKQHEHYYRVPGRREYYMDYRRCKYCGYQDTENYSLEFEN